MDIEPGLDSTAELTLGLGTTVSGLVCVKEGELALPLLFHEVG